MAATVRTYAANVDFLQEGSAYARALARLPEERRERAQRFAFAKDRRLSVGAWLLLEYAVAREGVDLSRSVIVRGEYGKPAFVCAAAVSAPGADQDAAPPSALASVPAVSACESGEIASMAACGPSVSRGYAADGASPTAVPTPVVRERDGFALAAGAALPSPLPPAPVPVLPSPLPPAPIPLLHFNLSHSGSEVLCAVSRECEVGCDVEELREFDEALARYCMQPAEVEALLALPAGERSRAFIRRWVCKESYMKAWGKGLSLPPDSFAVEPAADLSVPAASGASCDSAAPAAPEAAPAPAAPEAAPAPFAASASSAPGNPALLAARASAAQPVSFAASASAAASANASSAPASSAAACPAPFAVSAPVSLLGIPAVPARVTDDAACALVEFPCSDGYAYAACALDPCACFAPLCRVPGTLLE